jgi:hypothetical protein
LTWVQKILISILVWQKLCNILQQLMLWIEGFFKDTWALLSTNMSLNIFKIWVLRIITIEVVFASVKLNCYFSFVWKGNQLYFGMELNQIP